jgi:hypothetical protein
LDIPEKTVVVDKKKAAQTTTQHAQKAQPSRGAPQPHHAAPRSQDMKRNKKAQVSVFKMPSQ